MKDMDKIKAELTAITEKYKKDFETEINGERVLKTILDVDQLINEYKVKLNEELLSIGSNQLQNIDKSEEVHLTEFIRGRLIHFINFANTFL